ncbi:hypothetical protein MTR67_025358 [Solanum verrucosum]|uniref:Uncharacterized protein n=1 Tax=Solanum verrucosum TaxID=315347 RepID=A0AAF0TZC6_SOLVR|nr:hypothetical protein MTR67_025358 [Solanum verrucosum]
MQSSSKCRVGITKEDTCSHKLENIPSLAVT